MNNHNKIIHFGLFLLVSIFSSCSSHNTPIEQLKDSSQNHWSWTIYIKNNTNTDINWEFPTHNCNSRGLEKPGTEYVIYCRDKSKSKVNVKTCYNSGDFAGQIELTYDYELGNEIDGELNCNDSLAKLGFVNAKNFSYDSCQMIMSGGAKNFAAKITINSLENYTNRRFCEASLP